MNKKAHIIIKARKKALQSNCHFKISAIGFSRKGNILGSVTNHHRFSRKGGGKHAELRLMERFGMGLHTILICRVGKGGDILPIDPCYVCQAMADKLGIKIITVK